jgi:predicted DNA-binding transcriptional regulator AlpA
VSAVLQILHSPQSPAAPDDAQLIEASELWSLLSISAATGWRWKAAGRLPKPIDFGSASRSTLRWRLAEVRAWIAAGCPRKAEWEAMQAATKPARR